MSICPVGHLKSILSHLDFQGSRSHISNPQSRPKYFDTSRLGQLILCIVKRLNPGNCPNPLVTKELCHFWTDHNLLIWRDLRQINQTLITLYHARTYGRRQETVISPLLPRVYILSELIWADHNLLIFKRLGAAGSGDNLDRIPWKAYDPCDGRV